MSSTEMQTMSAESKREQSISSYVNARDAAWPYSTGWGQTFTIDAPALKSMVARELRYWKNIGRDGWRRFSRLTAQEFEAGRAYLTSPAGLREVAHCLVIFLRYADRKRSWQLLAESVVLAVSRSSGYVVSRGAVLVAAAIQSFEIREDAGAVIKGWVPGTEPFGVEMVGEGMVH